MRKAATEYEFSAPCVFCGEKCHKELSRQAQPANLPRYALHPDSRFARATRSRCRVIKGRKEHVVVDTLGLPMGVVVHEANIHDSVGAHTVIDSMRGNFPRLKKILADGGYKGQKLIDDARTKLGAEFKVVLRPDESSKKFAVLPLRWIVERSFSWLENFRRIAMDYEFYSETGVAMVQLAFCRLMYNKIYD